MATTPSGGVQFGEAGTEQLLPSKEERTSTWTHYCCHAVRLLFLLSHGLCLLCVSTAFAHLEQASWWLLFLPVWVGDALCGVLIIASWFVSCPYIKLCLAERQPRVGNHPSILTEIMPEILLSVLGLFFLVLTFVGEYTLCVYLDSEQHGEPRGLPAAALLLCCVGLLAACHGVLLTHNSPLYVLGGSGLLLTAILFAATREGAPGVQAIVVVPAALVMGGLVSASLYRLVRYLRVLNREERVLRSLEVLVLTAVTLDLFLLTAKVGSANLARAGSEGRVAGLSLCLLAALRARLCWWEAARGSLEERLITEAAEAGAVSAQAREVQISNVHTSA